MCLHTQVEVLHSHTVITAADIYESWNCFSRFCILGLFCHHSVQPADDGHKRPRGAATCFEGSAMPQGCGTVVRVHPFL